MVIFLHSLLIALDYTEFSYGGDNVYLVKLFLLIIKLFLVT